MRALRLAACLGALLLTLAASTSHPELRVGRRTFTVDGRARFLLGVSLFDALGQTPPRDEDLDAIRASGISIVRVWAHWHDPIYARDGALTPEGRDRLERLVARLAARRLTLELVLLRPGQMPGQPYAAFASADARTRAVEELTRALLPDRDALFDLCNEHDHPDGPLTHAEARVLRDAVKRIDPARVVTISSTEYHFVSAKGTIEAEGRRNLQEEAGSGPGEVGVDVLSAHLPRTADWAKATGPRVTVLLRALGGIAATMPLYLSEENRSKPGETIPTAAYLDAARQAREAGAAGWVFHTEAGFDLARRPFLDALVPEERAALDRLAAAVTKR